MSDPLQDIIKKAVSGMGFLPELDRASVSPDVKQGLGLSQIKVHREAFESNPEQAAFMAEHGDHIHSLQMRMHADPESVIDELYDLVLDYPAIPLIRNHLFIALKYAEYADEAAAVCAETYFRFPKYVFAFTNYLTLLDEFGRGREVDLLLHDINGVQDIDPSRSEYHVSEVFSFEGMMCIYLVNRDMIEPAASRLAMAASLVAEDDPRILALREEFEYCVALLSMTKPKPKPKSKSKSKSKKKK